LIVIQFIRDLFGMPNRKDAPQSAGQKGVLPKKGKRFVMDGWVFEVTKITARGMICKPLGVVVEKEAPRIIQPQKSGIIMP